MKVIDLLNKIANGEEVPRQVDYYDITYTYNGDCYVSNEGELLLDDIEELTRCLNEEIEIIEEDKKIEKIDLRGYYNDYSQDIEEYCAGETTLAIKINEIIDKLNKLKGDNDDR